MTRPFEPGYFGKLPIAADFLGRHSGDDEAPGLERWLLDGVRLAWERFGSAGNTQQLELPPLRFLFWARNPGAFLIGALSRGRDKSGRKFPFASFVQNGIPDLGARAFALPVAFSSFLAAAGELAHRESGAPADLYAALEEAATLIPSPIGSQALSLESVFGGHTVAEIEPEDSDGAADGDGAADRGLVGRVLAVLSAQGRRNAAMSRPRTFGLRFPLPAGGAPRDLGASFWLEATRRAFRESRVPPVCFWTAEPGEGVTRGWLDVYPGPPSHLSYLHLLDAGFASDRLVPLAGESAGIPPGGIVEPDRPLLDALDLTLGSSG